MHSVTRRCWSALAQPAAKTTPQGPVINKQSSNLSNLGAWWGNHVWSFLCTAHASPHPIATLTFHSGLSHRTRWSSRFGHYVLLLYTSVQENCSNYSWYFNILVFATFLVTSTSTLPDKVIVYTDSGFQVNAYCSTNHSSWPNGWAADQHP